MGSPIIPTTSGDYAVRNSGFIQPLGTSVPPTNICPLADWQLDGSHIRHPEDLVRPSPPQLLLGLDLLHPSVLWV